MKTSKFSLLLALCFSVNLYVYAQTNEIIDKISRHYDADRRSVSGSEAAASGVLANLIFANDAAKKITRCNPGNNSDLSIKNILNMHFDNLKLPIQYQTGKHNATFNMSLAEIKFVISRCPEISNDFKRSLGY